MNMGKVLFFIVVIFSVSLKANANTSKALKNASDITQALAISELSTNGAALSFERRLPKTPAAKTTIDCFKRDYGPKAHVYFTQIISQSLDNKTLAEGASLANRDAVNKNYEFILNNSEHLKSKAKANKKRLDSYVLIEAAKLLARNELIHFVLVGGGKNKCELVELVRKYSLTNVTFLPSIRKEQVQSALKYFDACYLGWHKSSLYRFVIAPNKLPEYFYAKKPVLHSYSGVKDMVQEAGAGLSVDAANPSELAGAILRLSVMDKKELDRMGNHGFNYAISKLSYSNISNDLANLF